MSDLYRKTLAELAALLHSGEVSSSELTQHFLSRISQHDEKLNSFITVVEEQAMAQAAEADKALKNGAADLALDRLDKFRHAKGSTTEIYMHLAPRTLKEAIRDLRSGSRHDAGIDGSRSKKPKKDQ